MCVKEIIRNLAELRDGNNEIIPVYRMLGLDEISEILQYNDNTEEIRAAILKQTNFINKKNQLT